jgi:hypothetical protein
MIQKVLIYSINTRDSHEGRETLKVACLTQLSAIFTVLLCDNTGNKEEALYEVPFNGLFFGSDGSLRPIRLPRFGSG